MFDIKSCVNTRSDEWIIGYYFGGKWYNRLMGSNREPTMGEMLRELREVHGFF